MTALALVVAMLFVGYAASPDENKSGEDEDDDDM